MSVPNFVYSDAVIDADCITRSQWRDIHAPAISPLQKLYMAVLVDALACLRGRGVMESGYRAAANRAKARREAVAWVRARDLSPFSFEVVSEALNLDPDWLRERILKQRIGQLPRRSPTNIGSNQRIGMNVQPYYSDTRGARVR